MAVCVAAMWLGWSGDLRAAPMFEDVTAWLGSPQPCFDPANPDAEGCYSHYVVMADLDADGDLDLIFAAGGGYYTSGSTAPLVAYWNDGSGHFTLASDAFGDAIGRTRQIAVGDVDGDGDLDVFVPQGYGPQAEGIADRLFIHQGTSPPTFADEAASRIGTTSRAGATRFGDVDGDGDLDLVVTDWGDAPPSSHGTARVYANDGSGSFHERVGAFPADLSAIGTGPIDVDLFDVDGDFDLDVVIASRVGSSLFLVNDGSGTFASAPFPEQPGPYVYGPDVCDVDGDGDLDLWLDNGGAGHHEQLLLNDGKGAFSDETQARVVGNPSADDNEVQCADVDGDGDFDAVIASLSDHERVLLNDGTGHFSLSADAFPPIFDSTLGLDLGDVDGDRVLDAVTAQGESGPFLNRLYRGAGVAPADTRPPVFRAVERLGQETDPGDAVVRFAVSDASTTDEGPRLREARVEVQGGQSHAAHFVGGDLFRAVIPIASGVTVYRPCATDWAQNSACGEWITVHTSTKSGASTSGVGGASASSPSAGSGLEVHDGEASGCGCRAAQGPSRWPLALVALGLLALVRRAR